MLNSGFLKLGLREAKSSFFDRARIMNKMSVSDQWALSKCGAYVRSAARRSFRKPPKKRKYNGGRAPYNITGKLRESIVFAYAATKKSVVIGPYLFPGVAQDVPAPQLLEFGGVVNTKTHTFIYHAYPYMRPAFERSKDKLAQFYENSFNRR
jgi:hypothetical protein